MPIRINSTETGILGRMSVNMSGFSVDFDGTHTEPSGIVGAMNPTIDSFVTSFIGQFSAPASFDGLISTTLDGFSVSFKQANTASIDNFPFVSAAMIISGGADKWANQPTRGIVRANNIVVDQGIRFNTSTNRANLKAEFAAARAENPGLIIVAHQDFLTILFDESSTDTYRWLEDLVWGDPANQLQYLLREGSTFVTHATGQGSGIAFNWACSDAVMQDVVEGQLSQYTDNGGAQNLMPDYQIHFMHDTMNETPFSQYRETVHDGTISSITSSTEINVPTWSGVNTTGSPDGQGYTSLARSTRFIAIQANGQDGSSRTITGHRFIGGGSRIRLSSALAMNDQAGDGFYIYETTGSSGGGSTSANMGTNGRLNGVLNFYERYRDTALSQQGVEVDFVRNGGDVTHTKKVDGDAPAYPSSWIGKWGFVQIERICSFSDSAGFFQYDYNTYRTASVGGGSSNIKDQDFVGRNFSNDLLMRCIEYNKLMLMSNESSVSGYPGVWLNAQTRFFSNYSNLTELDAAYARFWCCLAWTMDNVYPQVEMDKLHQWPVMIDEQIISAGNPIGTRNYGTYDPLANGGTGSFSYRTPDFGTFGYFFEYENCAIVINLRPPSSLGIWVPSWQSGGQSINTSLDRFFLPSAGTGKKWQRFNRNTYINTDSSSKFFNKSPTDYDTDEKIMSDTTWNDGSDVTFIDAGALEAAVIMRVDV